MKSNPSRQKYVKSNTPDSPPPLPASLLLLTIAAFFFVPSPVHAWDDTTHLKIARAAAARFSRTPSAIVKNSPAFFDRGVTDEPELFETVSASSRNTLSPEKIRSAGTDRFYAHYRRCQTLIASKSPSRSIAYEIGRLSRSAADLLEPLPPSNDFDAIQFSALRTFFMQDSRQSAMKFKNFYTSSPIAISSYPVRLAREFEASDRTGAIIYTAYHKGYAYTTVEEESFEMMNRATNFIADTVATLYSSQSRSERIFNPHDTIPFKSRASSSKPGVKAPNAPKPPAPPDSKSSEKESPSDGKNSDKSNKASDKKNSKNSADNKKK